MIGIIYLFPIGIHGKKWKVKLTYIIQNVGHCDLIILWVRASHPKCLWTKYGLSNSDCLDLCHQSLRTDGRTLDKGWSHKHSLSLQLKSWAKKYILVHNFVLDWGIDLNVFCYIPEFTPKNWGLPETTGKDRKLPKTAGNCWKRPENGPYLRNHLKNCY